MGKRQRIEKGVEEEKGTGRWRENRRSRRKSERRRSGRRRSGRRMKEVEAWRVGEGGVRGGR